MPRRLLLLLAALTVLALTGLAGIATAAASGVGAQNRVRAFDETAPSLIGIRATESPCSRPSSIGSTAEVASGFCVATEDGMAGVRAAGQEGENLAGIVKNTQRIPSATGTAAYRIPDELGDGVLGEVKNVKSLSYTNQLQDFFSYAQDNNLGFNLYVRPSTTFSGPLQSLIDSGAINRIPSLGP